MKFAQNQNEEPETAVACQANQLISSVQLPCFAPKADVTVRVTVSLRRIRIEQEQRNMALLTPDGSNWVLH